MYKKVIIPFFLFSLSAIITLAQSPDSQKKDSTKVYKQIETYSKKRGFTNFLHGLFFRPVETKPIKTTKARRKILQKPYRNFEGKIIRNIEIVTLDPFGFSANDTNVVVQNRLYKTGNRLHIKSQEITIRNLLLIRKNETFDSLLVKESERLIRSQKYIQDVSIFTSLAGRNSDSVNIFIRVVDLWSIIPEGAISPTRVTIGLNEKNFLGTGHNFENVFTWNHSNGNNIYNSNYFIPNIKNTYINTSLHYGIDENENYIKSLNVERPFFSPFAKWAAGAYFEKQSAINGNQGNYPDPSIKVEYTTQDYWAGIATRVFKGNTEEARTTNLITSLRYLRIRFPQRPGSPIDSLHIYSKEDFYLTGLGLSRRTYIKDKYIFNFGLIEDVPVGSVYGLTGGFQVRNNEGRFYLGGRFSFGDFHDWGYLSANFEYGTFFLSSIPEQSVFIAEVNYFTELIEIGNWKFRQFIKPQLSLGFNRFATEQLSINNENGIAGFNSVLLTGTKKIILTFQTQSYAPWNVLGFRFGPYLTCSLGMLGDELNGFHKSRVYSQFGLGFLIKNEFLVFNYIQISVAFYPSIPGIGENIVKINPLSTSDFGFQNFELGKPVTVDYR